MKFRAFMSRYAHYVLLRAQCFGGVFDEIKQEPTPPKSSKKVAKKPITSTSLRAEHLEAATMILKAGVSCSLKDGEESESTALAVERVASDLIGLTTAVATALNRALKSDSADVDPAMIKKWCEFYSEELLPKTKSMVKKTSAKLDAYGLFLPSRMGAGVPQELLQKGLKGEESSEKAVEKEEAEEEEEKAEEQPAEESADESEAKEAEEVEEEPEQDAEDENIDEYDEYDYEEEEYYDDEEA